MAISYSIGQHAVAYPSKVLARDGGAHILNITLKENVDNGWFVGKGAFVELDRYEEAAPTSVSAKVLGKAANGNYYVEIVSTENAYFVYQVPMIEEEYNNTFKKESNFFNANGTTVRAYELKPLDVVEISASGFSATPSASGVTVTLQTISGVTYAQQLGE